MGCLHLPRTKVFHLGRSGVASFVPTELGKGGGGGFYQKKNKSRASRVGDFCIGTLWVLLT